MNRDLQFQRLARRYATVLRKYAAEQRETVLEEAYELGRAAVAAEAGILDLARIHVEAREKLLQPASGAKNHARISKLTGVVFLQALSPFEAMHRGFRELNGELQQRNRELEAEAAVRKRLEESLRRLSRRILRVQEEQRRRLSRELHDEVGQSLTAISVTLAALRHGSEAKRADFARTIGRVQRLLEETMEAVHRFALELRPALLDELGLLPALRSHIKRFSQRTGLRIRLVADAAAEQLDNDQKTAVFRIAQESLTNVARHAHASRVRISIRRSGGNICMEVFDNGKSFREAPPGAARQRERLGLLGMQERARLANGLLTIKPEPGKGTTVWVTIPLPGTAQKGKPRRF